MSLSNLGVPRGQKAVSNNFAALCKARETLLQYGRMYREEHGSPNPTSTRSHESTRSRPPQSPQHCGGRAAGLGRRAAAAARHAVVQAIERGVLSLPPVHPAARQHATPVTKTLTS